MSSPPQNETGHARRLGGSNRWNECARNASRHHHRERKWTGAKLSGKSRFILTHSWQLRREQKTKQAEYQNLPRNSTSCKRVEQTENERKKERERENTRWMNRLTSSVCGLTRTRIGVAMYVAILRLGTSHGLYTEDTSQHETPFSDDEDDENDKPKTIITDNKEIPIY